MIQELTKKHLSAIKSAHNVDYHWNGEDEVTTDTFDDEQVAIEATKISFQFAVDQLKSIEPSDFDVDYSEILRTVRNSIRVKIQELENKFAQLK